MNRNGLSIYRSIRLFSVRIPYTLRFNSPLIFLFCPQVKATTPKMDRNGYFFYSTSTAKKKKISLMQPKPPRMAFEEKRRPGVAERLHGSFSHSVASTASESGRVEPMSFRAGSDAPRARLYTQLESYQPRYHTIRETSEKRVDSECKRRRNEQRRAGHQSVR